MLSFDEALERVRGVAPLLMSEVVALEAAHGRILTEPLHAPAPLPAVDYSAMDGYALRSTSLTGEPPWELPVAGESRTGRPPPAWQPGSACRIFTGAGIPDGCDAVVMQEDVVLVAGTVKILERVGTGDHVRRAGEDLAKGALALAAGTRLGPYQLGLVAALDRAEVRVARRPRVTILCTGDELRRAGTAPRAASIPESNSVVIAALAASAGARVTTSEPSSDTLDETRRKLAGALASSDVVVTVGGVSVGDHDVVRPALEAEGVALELYKVRMKPGKPLTLGKRGEVVVLGLPGNPVSAQVTFSLFGLPLLRWMQGDVSGPSRPRPLRLAAPIRQKTGRRGFYAAKLDGDTVTPLSGQSSGSTVSLARADALIVVPEDSTGYEAGQTADVVVLSEL